jgi:hypothetical protein
LAIDEARREGFLKALLGRDEQTSLGYWFELVLLDWLSTVGSVTFGPAHNGSLPDFALNVGESRVLVEAKAFAYSDRVHKASSEHPESAAQEIHLEPLKDKLRKSIRQHHSLRGSRLPVIWAIYLQNPFLTASEVVDVWFGRPSVRVNLRTLEASPPTVDRFGIRSISGGESYKHVACILVFKRTQHIPDSAPLLDAWQIQNPYAATPMPRLMFPVVAEFSVDACDDRYFHMSWKQR